MNPDDMSGAKFSPCGSYRYLLWRRWAREKCNGTLLCVLLNPSTAGAVQNDPTVGRCLKRAVQMGFGALEVVNLFALRSTDPGELRKHREPIGPDNDRIIGGAAARADMVLCGWGSHGKYLGRQDAVLKLFRGLPVFPYVLGMNADGTPLHPLYVSYKVQPTRWEGI